MGESEVGSNSESQREDRENKGEYLPLRKMIFGLYGVCFLSLTLSGVPWRVHNKIWEPAFHGSFWSAAGNHLYDIDTSRFMVYLLSLSIAFGIIGLLCPARTLTRLPKRIVMIFYYFAIVISFVVLSS